MSETSFTEEGVKELALCLHGERRKFCAKCLCTKQSWESDEFLERRRAGVKERLLEAQIQEECTKLLEEDGWRSLRTDPVSDRARGKGFGEVGMADHLYIRYQCAYIGDANCDVTAQVLWIEFKRPGEKAKKHQQDWHAKERARGAVTMIAGEDFLASTKGFKAWYAASGLMRRSQWW